MDIATCSMVDYEQIRRDVLEFWGSERMLHVHHPILVREFGNSAFVGKEAGLIVAYLFGFLSQTAPVGYVHLSAVRRGYRRRGLGRRLYDRFTEFAAGHGCQAIKAMTTSVNHISIAFHTGIGMEMQGVPNAEGIPVVCDYSGPGDHRVIFLKPIGRQAPAAQDPAWSLTAAGADPDHQYGPEARNRMCRRLNMSEIQEFGGLEFRPGALDLKSQHLIAWSAALLTDCWP